MLKATYISSSNIECAGYKLSTLYLKFKSGGVYAYDKVPFSYFVGLQEASSAGQYFHRMIKKAGFHYTRLESDPFSN